MTYRKKSRIRDEAIEEAARRYFELTLYGEPMTSPEHVFREVTGRLPTAREAAKVKERISELDSCRRKNRKQK